jgi:hypothetical protein
MLVFGLARRRAADSCPGFGLPDGGAGFGEVRDGGEAARPPRPDRAEQRRGADGAQRLVERPAMPCLVRHPGSRLGFSFGLRAVT